MLMHMRTTIVLEDDLSLEIERIAGERNMTKKQVIDELLRRGLASESPRDQPPVQTIPQDLGTCRIPSPDNVAEVIAAAEGEAFK